MLLPSTFKTRRLTGIGRYYHLEMILEVELRAAIRVELRLQSMSEDSDGRS